MNIRYAVLLLMSTSLFAQTPPRYEVDPTWPKPLPEDWTWGRLGGICVDSHDHVAVVDRRDISDEEAETSHRAPPIVIFDAAGTVIFFFSMRYSGPRAISTSYSPGGSRIDSPSAR